MHNGYMKRNTAQLCVILMMLFFFIFTQNTRAQFESLKPLEESPMSSEKYNFSTLVEGDGAYYFIYRLGGPDLVYDTHRFQLVKTDLEGNTIFQKEIAAPEEINFFWGYNSATPPPIAYANGRLSVVVSALAVTTEASADNYLFQFIFDEDGNLIQNNFFEVDVAHEFCEITSVEDGFLFATSPIYLDAPEAPTNLHVFKTDIDGNLIWEKAYQFTEGYNTIYLKDIIQTYNGDIYIAIFNYPLTGGLDYGEAIIKLDNDGEFLFAKRYYDPDLIGGNIYNMSLAFQSHNESDELMDSNNRHMAYQFI